MIMKNVTEEVRTLVSREVIFLLICIIISLWEEKHYPEGIPIISSLFFKYSSSNNNNNNRSKCYIVGGWELCFYDECLLVD
jgi:hypothetical protein